MRSLRSIINKIFGDDIKKDWFNTVFTGRTNTEKRSVPESDIVKLRDLKLKQSSFAFFVRDLFIFSFYALGMPFVDLAFLKKEQIKDDKLTYFRHKTGQNITIKLEPCMKEILYRYLSANRDYAFPIINSSNNDKAYAEYLIMLNRYNRTLKKIAQKAGIQSRLTSYTPRHTWASLAYNNCIDLHVISKALGHSNPQTTLTYIRQIDDTRLEEANHSIISKVALNRC
jgi:integrase